MKNKIVNMFITWIKLEAMAYIGVYSWKWDFNFHSIIEDLTIPLKLKENTYALIINNWCVSINTLISIC